jgi:hypothetical protein
MLRHETDWLRHAKPEGRFCAVYGDRPQKCLMGLK